MRLSLRHNFTILILWWWVVHFRTFQIFKLLGDFQCNHLWQMLWRYSILIHRTVIHVFSVQWFIKIKLSVSPPLLKLLLIPLWSWKRILFTDQGSDINVVSAGCVKLFGLPTYPFSKISFQGFTMRIADHKKSPLRKWIYLDIGVQDI